MAELPVLSRWRTTAKRQPELLVTTATGGRALSAMLMELSADTLRERISISDLLVALGDRATAALLFIFAFPNALPTPPGTSTVPGAPLVFLAAQLMLGRASGYRPSWPSVP